MKAIVIFSSAALFLSAGCGPSAERLSELEKMATTLPLSTSAQHANKLHYQLQLNFTTNNAISTAHLLETACVNKGGYVGLSSMVNQTLSATTLSVSADSSDKILLSQNNISIRVFVPVGEVNGFLSQLSNDIVLLHERKLTGTNHSSLLAQNEVLREAFDSTYTGFSNTPSSQKAPKHSDYTNRKDFYQTKAQLAAEATTLKENSEFATIDLQFSDLPKKQVFRIPNFSVPGEYGSDFLSQFLSALTIGLHALQTLLLLLAKVWPLLVLVLALYAFITGRPQKYFSKLKP